jgi:CRISPR-associated protein Csm4
MEKIAEALKSKIIREAKEETQAEIEEENELQFSKRIVISRYKSFNKPKYISESLFNRLVKGEKITELYRQYLEKKLKIIKGIILLTSEEFDKIGNESLMETKTSARNKIDRLSFSTVPGGELYYEEETYLNPEVFRLYFFLLTEDIDFFIPIFRWLSDTGIGGNRTVGRGHYDIKIESEVKLPDMTNHTLFISLSKYLPADNEIDWQSEKNYYKLIPYQPRFDTMFFKGGEFIKERITYLKEGSILQAKEKKEYYGRLYPSAKFQDKTIYQSGLTIPLFMKTEE